MAAWVEHKRAKGKPYKSTQGPQAVLNMLAPFGPFWLSKQIQQSIASNWDGVFEPKDAKGSAPAPVPELDREAELIRQAEERRLKRERWRQEGLDGAA